jgi:hypothetical protein
MAPPAETAGGGIPTPTAPTGALLENRAVVEEAAGPLGTKADTPVREIRAKAVQIFILSIDVYKRKLVGC